MDISNSRELKTALERFWAGKSDAETLLAVAADLRAKTWARQRALGVDHIPSNDFSFYDHVLDTSAMVGAVPDIYGWAVGGSTPHWRLSETPSSSRSAIKKSST